MTEQLKQLAVDTFVENWPFIKIVCVFVAYAALEYWFGKTDKVKEGSFGEFVWARVKGLFSPSRGVPPNDPKL